MVAYAVLIKPENFGAIASEKPDFDREALEEWAEHHENGYFLRDPDSVLDCKYFDRDVFFEMYAIDYGYKDGIFQRVVKLDQ